MRLLGFTILLLLASCNAKEKVETISSPDKTYANVDLKYKNDTLFALYKEEGDGAPGGCGFVNKNGDTIIPVDDCSHCFTDTFSTYAIVVSEKLTESKIAAINRKNEVIWEPFLFDNWPDEASEGLFRIERNGKIGYANLDGEVVIDTKYGCASDFQNNQARVALKCESIKDEIEHITWESDEWFYIDRKGNRVK